MGGLTTLALTYTLALQGPRISTSLISTASDVRAGESFYAVVRLDIERAWHIYWTNPGDTGIATAIDWQLPKGFIVQSVQFPTPKKFVSNESVSYGHEGEVLILARIKSPLGAQGKYHLSANLEWLACIEACIPGRAQVSTEINIGTLTVLKPNALELLHQASRSAPGYPSFTVRASRQGGAYRLGVARPADQAYFFADDPEVISAGAAQPFRRIDDGFELSLQPSTYGKKDPVRLKGVIVVESAGGAKQAYRIDALINQSKGASK